MLISFCSFDRKTWFQVDGEWKQEDYARHTRPSHSSGQRWQTAEHPWNLQEKSEVQDCVQQSWKHRKSEHILFKNAYLTCLLKFQCSFCFICLQKLETVNENKMEFSKLDENQSYCFSVAAYIPSRKGDNRVGEWSLPKCFPQEQKTVFEGKSQISTFFLSYKCYQCCRSDFVAAK